MDKDFHETFDKCPCCGSDQRFLEQLAQELKDRGLAREDWHQHYDVRQGVVIDKNRTVMLPIGIKLPGYHITTDICMECGCLYATELRRLEGQTQTAPLSSDGLITDPSKFGSS